MYGTLTGNLLAAAYFLYFQLTGFVLTGLLFRREAPLPRLLTGSVAGSLLMIWLPILFSFFFDFTLTAHILGLAITLPLHILSLARLRRRSGKSAPGISLHWADCKRHLPFLTLLFLTLAFWTYLLYTHTLLPEDSGALRTGQCTYGDMNMHLGFITSLARQHSFPPDYSILPGVRLSYPFLSDSISSSLYLLGASLRFAYILPMLFAMAHVFTAVYLFAASLLPSRKEGSPSAVPFLALLFFFCNGGLGFAYFMDWSADAAYSLSDIFTGFYTTPTNLVGHNIRWVNIIADMLLPQRATLFGYSVLFPGLWLLYQAAFRNRQEYFPMAGLFLSALPMIHTHSFLSAAVICAAWLLLWLSERVPSFRIPRRTRVWGLALLVGFLCLLQQRHRRTPLPPSVLMVLGLIPFFAAILLGCGILWSYVRQQGWKKLLRTWGVCLVCILAPALPQLLFWTFGQVARGGFLRGYFNWANQGDFYPWFYLKNIGMPLLLILGGVCACRRRTAPLFLPALLLWWLSEFIVFTPNTYDNNKLLYVAYFLLCIGAADYAETLYAKIRSVPGSRLLSAAFLFFSVLSGLLTLGREAVSDYQLYSPAQVALADYVKENVPPDAVCLTDMRHNNEIASLTGRNIMCGADTFLYYHGLDTTDRKADLRLMYEAPLAHPELFAKYGVAYVVVSSFERRSYAVDEAAFQSSFTTVFLWGDTALYAVP